MQALPLAGRTAVVTGARSGIGLAIASAMAEAGADVVGVGRSPSPDAAAAVESHGRRFLAITCDLSTAGASEVEAVMQEVAVRTDGVDILVNNAGQVHRAPALELAEQDWNRIVGLNLSVPFYLSQAMARLQDPSPYRRRKIVNIASMLSFQGGINTAAYAASKTGILGLTRTLCNEWAPTGINVNAVAPGYVETDATAALRADPVRSAQILDRIPQQRWGRPIDIADPVVFLCSSASDYVNGAVLPVDGGWLAR